MKIKVLDEIIANVIAAGEVIERPASVIKELVENSLDAEAHKIIIRIDDCGRKLIEVDDDGVGMDENDALLAFTRHATSKIVSKKDLFSIKTLGFRGEALPSIASVSKVTLETSFNKSGTQIVMQGGKLLWKKSYPLRKGTKIQIRDLFFNTPARYKFMKSDITENSNIIETVSLLALSHPSVVFQLFVNDRLTFRTTGSGNILEIISDIYSYDTSRNMLAIKAEDYDFKITGYISKPTHTKSNRYSMNIFVNNRCVRAYPVQNRIIEGYGSNIADNRYPITAIFIEVDPQLIDINVHPSKKEIKFSKEKELLDLIYQAVSQVFKSEVIIPKISTPNVIFSPNVASSTNVTIQEEEVRVPFDDLLVEVTEDDDTGEIETLEVERPVVYHQLQMKLEIEEVKNYRILGQVRDMYIAVEMQDGLYLVDQHAAMERINFERFQRILEQDITTIAPLIPYVIDIKVSDHYLFESYFPKLRQLGFIFEYFSGRSFRLAQQPTWMMNLNEKYVVNQIVKIIFDCGEINADILRRDQIASIACKASLKALYKLSMEEMEKILDDLYKCREPSTCPHGRPVIVSYPYDDIDKAFKRTGFR